MVLDPHEVKALRDALQLAYAALQPDATRLDSALARAALLINMRAIGVDLDQVQL